MNTKEEDCIINDLQTLLFIRSFRMLIEDSGKIGSFAISYKGMAHPKTMQTPETEQYVMNNFEETRSTSTRGITVKTCVSHAKVW